MQLKFAVAIPVYNHPATVVDVIHRSLQSCHHPIIVVDDGSIQDVKELYLKTHTEIDPRLFFLRHEKNKGKGQAIRTAIDFSTQQGWTHLVTIDADGQHDPEEIDKLTAAALKKPWAVILGDREMVGENIPPSSVFGKAFSNFWVRYETDTHVSDSQSGFRLYPLYYLQTVDFFSKRYDFEVEVLTRMIWKKVEIVSVPVKVKYFPNEKRVTHFHKFRDNFRLVILNTLLVSSSLLHRKDPPFKSALAVAIGIFIGAIPLYGFHGLIVAGLAFLLRMNFLYLFLGTQISIPPMIPVLVIGAHTTAEWILNHPPEGIFGFSRDWIYGILGFATFLSMIIGVVVYVIKLHLQSRAQQNQHEKISVKEKSGIGIGIMSLILKHVGLRAAYFCLYFVVPVYFLISFKARASSREFCRVLNPKATVWDRQVLLWRQLMAFARSLVDRAYQRFFMEVQDGRRFHVTERHGIDEFKEALISPQGCVTLQSHFGGWELSLNYFRHITSDKEVIAIMYGISDSYRHTSLGSQQGNSGKLKIAYYNMQNETVGFLRESLLKGNIVGLMGDRPVGRSLELIPFFNKLAAIDTSGFRLASLCNVAVYAIFSIKKGLLDYDVAIHRVSNAQDYAKTLEHYVLNNPEQWFNFNSFWSRHL